MDSIHARLLSSYGAAYDSFPPPPPRRSSTTSTTSPAPLPPPPSPPPPAPSQQEQGSNSRPPSPSHQARLHGVRTRSVGGWLSSGVIFERDTLDPPREDDIIIVTVRVSKTNPARRNSYDDPLPDRPRPRTFLRRLSTRLGSPARNSKDKYKAVKMPRGEYLRYFRHDAAGHYAGTEPEREWFEDEVAERYARYQEMPLRAVLGAGTTGRRPGSGLVAVPVCGW